MYDMQQKLKLVLVVNIGSVGKSSTKGSFLGTAAHLSGLTASES